MKFRSKQTMSSKMVDLTDNPELIVSLGICGATCQIHMIPYDYV